MATADTARKIPVDIVSLKEPRNLRRGLEEAASDSDEGDNTTVLVRYFDSSVYQKWSEDFDRHWIESKVKGLSQSFETYKLRILH